MTPRRVLFLSVAIALAMCWSAMSALLGRPYAPLPPGAVPVAVSADSLRLDINAPIDLVEEPDKLPDYPAFNTFLDRQQALSEALGHPSARVAWLRGDEAGVAEVQPRGLTDLPPVFHFQLLVGVFGLMVGGWLVALRPRDPAVLLFGVTGISLALASTTAAVYSGRQIALPAETFRLLSGLNHIGATWFGVGLIGMFLLYPKRLVRPAWILLPAVLVALGNLLHLNQFTPLPLANPMVAVEALVALALAVAQWRLSRRMPLDRAGLKYLLMATLIGVAGFVGLSVMPTLMGSFAPVSQGYAFGAFLAMYAGIALGLARYRLFDLDRYAFRVWLWLGAGLMIVALDAALLLVLRDQPLSSFGLALLLGSFLYFPLRQALVTRVMSSRQVTLQGQMPDILAAALERDDARRARAWDALLRRLWAPLTIAPGDTVDGPRLLDHGMALALPDACGCGTRRLGHASAGRRLFNADDVAVAATLCDLVAMIRQSSEAFEQGVTTERDRIARDVHDNIGAQLLSALHAREAERKNELLREALTDLRGIIDADFTGTFVLADLMADLRGETLDRLANSGIALTWPPMALPEEEVSLQLATTIRAIVREAVSNAIRHSGCRMVTISPRADRGTLRLTLSDDGRATGSGRAGNGLENMRTRVRALKGTLLVRTGGESRDDSGVTIEVALPLIETADGKAA
ncbi:sensor histidine kinase [Sagittula salina]|uniref:histidine kinase n=1 Tax=Sagittula salina TaxID=2820268 RepID=A0A940MNV1_9RHOB|nr:ATP-binding protein [Sagittula salina]MBP0482739.1 hypothetical protein [Sagittula salina]